MSRIKEYYVNVIPKLDLKYPKPIKKKKKKKEQK